MIPRLRPLWALFVLLALAVPGLVACAPGNFKAPASAFHEAAKTAQASLASYEKALDDAVLEANINYVIEHRSSLRATQEDCRLGSSRCRLVVRPRNAAEYPLIPGPIDPNIRALMVGTVAYGASLDNIAQADIEADVKAAANQAKANGIDLAKAVDALAKSMNQAGPGLTRAAEAFGTPVADTVLYIAGRYVEALKLDALRRATKIGGQIFPALTEVFGALADQGMQVKRSYLYEAYVKADAAYNVDGPTPARLNALRTAAAAYDASLTSDPRAVFTALADSHRALADALQAPEPNFANLWPQLQRLAEEAQKLKEITEALRDARASLAKSASQ